jgi:hypothetical protein
VSRYRVALADPAPEDFAGIKWGSPISTAREKLTQRPGLVMDYKATTGSRLRFTGGTFAGFNVESWELSFGANGLFHASVTAHDDTGGDAFQKMKQEISAKYGGGRAGAGGARTRHCDWIMQ